MTNPSENHGAIEPLENPTPGKTGLYRFAAGILKPILHIVGNYKWAGVENIPQEGGIIVAANHASYIDPLTLAHYLYNANRPARILGKDSLFHVPVLGTLLNTLDMIPVYRGTKRAGESVEIAAQRLKEGYCIAVFPEGTLTKDPAGWPMKGRTGVARMALESRAPVIPVGQWGQLDMWAQDKKVPKLFPRQTVRVEAGPRVDLSDLYEQEITAEVLREATDRIMSAVTAIVATQRGEAAPTELFDPRAH